MSWVKPFLCFSSPITFSPRTQRKADIFELSRNMQIHKFIERNHLFTIPHVICFQAIKVGDDLMCVYNVGVFEFKDSSGYLERATVCQFVNSLFRSLGSIELGFVPEEDLEKGEEIHL